MTQGHQHSPAPLLAGGSCAVWFMALILNLAPIGCANKPSGPYTAQEADRRNPIEAQRLTRSAATLIDSDPTQAEQLLRRALSEDLYHGPAHNNLGVIYLKRGDLYAAASEFEWARKLIPGHPDPRLNLALTFERAGRRAEAMSTYESALEVYPGHIPTLQAMTRLALKWEVNLPLEELRTNLETIALNGETHAWRRWATGRLTAGPGRRSEPPGP